MAYIPKNKQAIVLLSKALILKLLAFLHHFRNSYLTMSCMDDLDHKYIENFRR